MLKFHWTAPHETICGQAKKLFLDESIPIGFNLLVYPTEELFYEKTTKITVTLHMCNSKASNVLQNYGKISCKRLEVKC